MFLLFLKCHHIAMSRLREKAVGEKKMKKKTNVLHSNGSPARERIKTPTSDMSNVWPVG